MSVPYVQSICLCPAFRANEWGLKAAGAVSCGPAPFSINPLCDAADFVHRVGPELLEKELQKKHEFVILMRLHKHQMRLYEAYVEVHLSEQYPPIDCHGILQLHRVVCNIDPGCSKAHL